MFLSINKKCCIFTDHNIKYVDIRSGFLTLSRSFLRVVSYHATSKLIIENEHRKDEVIEWIDKKSRGKMRK